MTERPNVLATDAHHYLNGSCSPTFSWWTWLPRWPTWYLPEAHNVRLMLWSQVACVTTWQQPEDPDSPQGVQNLRELPISRVAQWQVLWALRFLRLGRHRELSRENPMARLCIKVLEIGGQSHYGGGDRPANCPLTPAQYAAVEDEIIQSSPVDRVRIPKAKIDRRERAVLTDTELAIYLAWEQQPEQSKDQDAEELRSFDHSSASSKDHRGEPPCSNSYRKLVIDAIDGCSTVSLNRACTAQTLKWTRPLRVALGLPWEWWVDWACWCQATQWACSACPWDRRQTSCDRRDLRKVTA